MVTDVLEHELIADGAASEKSDFHEAAYSATIAIPAAMQIQGNFAK